MALAYLCSRVRRLFPLLKIADNPLANFWAIVVDHQVREGSAAEAKAVTEALSQLRIRTAVVPLTWKDSLEATGLTHPKDLPNFETVARRLRYQALARLCASFGRVGTLFLAHHQDDQYETLLMRLLSGHGAAGLRGMSPATDIPDCHHLHGAFQSGFVDDQLSNTPMYDFRPRRSEFASIRRQLRERIDPDLVAQELKAGVLSGGYLEDEFDAGVVDKRPRWMLPAMPLEVEDGGIVIYRPLLEFSKDRLIATCEANGVPWFEDPTNSDPTLTRRNAVRHMCRHHTLPVALQKPAILAMSQRLRRQAEMDEAEVDRLLARTIVRDFDSVSGTLVIRPPSFRIPRRHRLNHVGLTRRLAHYRHIAALLLKRLIAVVTPDLPGSSSSDLQATVLRLIPSLNDDPSTYPEQPKAFVIGGVHFLPVWTSKKHRRHLNWYLSREPYVSRRYAPLAQFGSLALSIRWRRRPDQWRWPKWRPFQLWDGRFWIRIANRSALSVSVLPFDEKDAKAFRESIPRGRQRDQLVAALKLHAPGKVRFTLPAIYTTDDLEDVAKNYERRIQQEKAEFLDEAEAEREWKDIKAAHGSLALKFAEDWERRKGLHPEWTPRGDWRQKYYDNPNRVLVALPTLGIARPGLQNWIKYEVRYKKVDRRLLRKSADDERDLEWYEKARRRASRTGRRARAEKFTAKHTRRPARGSPRGGVVRSSKAGPSG